MAWPYLTGTLKLIISYTIGGKVAVNIVYARTQDQQALSGQQFQEAADAAWVAWDTDWPAIAADTAEVSDIESISWQNADGALRRASQTLPIDGVEATTIVPNNVAFVVSHRTGTVGRSKRGRSYIPGFTEANLNGNNVNAAVQNGSIDIFETLDTELDAIGLEQVVYSLYEDGEPRAEPIATPVTSWQADTRVDTQRRRLPAP